MLFLDPLRRFKGDFNGFQGVSEGLQGSINEVRHAKFGKF